MVNVSLRLPRLFVDRLNSLTRAKSSAEGRPVPEGEAVLFAMERVIEISLGPSDPSTTDEPGLREALATELRGLRGNDNVVPIDGHR